MRYSLISLLSLVTFVALVCAAINQLGLRFVTSTTIAFVAQHQAEETLLPAAVAVLVVVTYMMLKRKEKDADEFSGNL